MGAIPRKNFVIWGTCLPPPRNRRPWLGNFGYELQSKMFDDLADVFFIWRLEVVADKIS